MAEPTSSLTAQVRPLAAGAPAVAAAFLAGQPALALADGTIVVGGPGDERKVVAHPEGAILVAARDGDALLTGGDDGRVVRTSAGGADRDHRRRARPLDRRADARRRARSPGRPASRRGPATPPAPSSRSPRRARCAASPSCPRATGWRLAHYNGASLWFPNAAVEPTVVEWKGSHLDVTASPDGRFLVTSMQENALHGWRLADGRNMRMTGYPAKSRSLAWSHDGAWLATSGADACVVWPFKDKDGPMGKAPRECGVRAARVTRVAFHPRALVVAIGYADGQVLMCRLVDAAEILVRAPGGGPIGALAWDATGAQLLFGVDDGAAGLLTLPA